MCCGALWARCDHLRSAAPVGAMVDYSRCSGSAIASTSTISGRPIATLLRRMIGSFEVTADQLRHLVQLDDLSNVSIRVVPMSARRHRGLLTGAFVLLEFPRHPTVKLTEPPVVYIEQYTGALYLEKPDEVQQYRDAYADVQRVALDRDDSRQLIQRLASELPGE
jgi:hypothetical protein